MSGLGRRVWWPLALGAVIALAGLAVVLAVALWAPWTRASGLAAVRSAEVEYSALRLQRAAALSRVWESLGRHRVERGEWPESQDALIDFDPVVADALEPPALSERGGYAIDLDALRDSDAGGPPRVIIMDPGYLGPAGRADEEWLEPFRIVLLSTGEVVDLATARRRGAVLD